MTSSYHSAEITLRKEERVFVNKRDHPYALSIPKGEAEGKVYFFLRLRHFIYFCYFDSKVDCD